MLVIILNTIKTFSRNKIFFGSVLASIFFVFFAYLLSTMTIVEKNKILLDFGLLAVSLSGVGIAIFTGIMSLSREIHTRTVYTILSKPINRVSYLLGSYLGCCVVVAVSVIIMFFNLYVIYYLNSQEFYIQLLLSMFLTILECLLVLAVAFAFSIVFNPFLATVLSIMVFLAGRSSYTFVLLAERSTSTFKKYAYILGHHLLPDLLRFDVRQLVAYQKPIPFSFVYWSTGYFFIYTAFLLVFSVIVFKHRDMP